MTIVVQIPSPLGGYIHLGDMAVLLCGFLLGPIWGAAAAGIGSMAGGSDYRLPTIRPRHFGDQGIGCPYGGINGTNPVKKPSPIETTLSFCCPAWRGCDGGRLFPLFRAFDGRRFCRNPGVTGNLVQAVAGVVISYLFMIAISKVNFKKTHAARRITEVKYDV